MHRVIFITVEEGSDPTVDWDGKFAYYDLLAVLERAHTIIEESEWEQHAEEEADQEGGGE